MNSKAVTVRRIFPEFVQLLDVLQQVGSGQLAGDRTVMPGPRADAVVVCRDSHFYSRRFHRKVPKMRFRGSFVRGAEARKMCVEVAIENSLQIGRAIHPSEI
jgi:hypothetical protein